MVVSVPLLSPTFEQPDEGTEIFSGRVNTGVRDREDSDEVFVVEAIERGWSRSPSGTRRGDGSTSLTRHEVVRQS